MERLTFTNEELKQLEIDCPVKNDYLVERFCDMVCDEFQGNCPYMKMAQKLKSYEDAEENGILKHLPCRIGDTVWYVDSDDDSYPIELCVTKIEIFKNAIFYRAVTTDDGTTAVFLDDDIGKTVFLTREEAEQALAQMKGVKG